MMLFSCSARQLDVNPSTKAVGTGRCYGKEAETRKQKKSHYLTQRELAIRGMPQTPDVKSVLGFLDEGSTRRLCWAQTLHEAVPTTTLAPTMNPCIYMQLPDFLSTSSMKGFSEPI